MHVHDEKPTPAKSTSHNHHHSHGHAHGHAHGHQHGHAHGHHHVHLEEGLSSRRIAWVFFLNLSFTIIEFIGGILTNSTAIMADAIHDLGDSLAIGLAWILSRLSDKKATNKLTYGYQRLSLFGALMNSIVLVIGSAWILTEAIPRLLNPEMPDAQGMIAFAFLGIAVNGYAAYKLSKGKSLNERVLNWHLMEDVFGWVAVLIVAIVLQFFDWPILDPLLSIVFTLFILFNVIRTLKETIHLFLQGVPDEAMRSSIESQLLKLDDVEDVHHLHLWSLDGERHVLTAHLVIAKSLSVASQQALKQQVALCLDGFSLAHTTIELEFSDEVCRDKK